MDSSFSSKLNEILKSRYGVTLKVHHLVLIEDEPLVLPTQNKKELHIPIYVKGNYLGKAVVKDVTLLPEQSIKNIVALVQMVLEPALFQHSLSHQKPGSNHTS